MAFLERTAQLEELREQLRRAGTGSGRVVLLGGEAGAGKTTLVRHLRREIGNQARVLAGNCDPLSTPRPHGPLFDMVDTLGARVEELLLAGAPSPALFRTVLHLLAAFPRPTVVIIEDLQWADEATLDLLCYLARRLDDLPLMVLATFRNDEIGPGHPLRPVLGELLRLPHAIRLVLPPLTPQAVALLAEGSAADPAHLYQQTGGNPFYVTEILAAGAGSIPDSVRDAVLARVSLLRPKTRGVLDAAAVLGLSVDPTLLVTLAVTTPEETTQALDECLASGVMHVEGEVVAFRHELARESILHAMSPVRRAALHAQVLHVLAAMTSPPADPAQLAHHAELAGDADAVLRYAPIAAQRAAILGAHREALAQYERALRFAIRLPDEERADLLSAASFEALLSSRMAQAIESRRAAIDLRRRLGDRLGEARDLIHLSRALASELHGTESERAAQDALTVLNAAEPGIELAAAYSNRSRLDMLAGHAARAVSSGERAIALAERFDAREPLIQALINVGYARIKMGDERGWDELERGLRMALGNGFQDQAARAYINLASARLRVFELDAAGQYLRAGIIHCTDYDLDLFRSYLLSVQATALFRGGRWRDAESAAMAVLNSTAAPLAQVEALTCLGRARVRRGDPAVREWLDRALALAKRSGQVLRIGPARIARAEAAWLAGDNDRALMEAEKGIEAAHGHDEIPLLAELAVWHRRSGGSNEFPPDQSLTPEPLSLDLTGDWVAAASAWEARGCPYESAMSLLSGADEAALRHALEIFTGLGARPAVRITTRKLRELGARDLPRGPRRSTRATPGNLTEREVAVLQLVAEGLRNTEIADRLFVSPHTVAHHVSAVLAKLGVRSRLEAVEMGKRLGITGFPDDSQIPSPI